MNQHRSVPFLSLVASGIALGLSIGTVALAGSSPLMHRYFNMALQGDLTTAAEIFSDVESLSGPEAELARKYKARFVDRVDQVAPVSGDAMVDDLILTYRDYWTRSLSGELGTDEGRAYLVERINGVLKRHDVEMGEGADTFETMESAVRSRGFHPLTGLTRPLYELMIWKTEDVRAYTVELTDAEQRVEVAMIGDFVSYGWAHYATFGVSYTGGWAASDRLYCLRDDYDLESEKFLISYLRHEGRHFADYELFPALDQIELEYRAKLTELSFAETSLHGLLSMFTAQASSNPKAPHAYANHAVIRDLAAEVFRDDQASAKDWSSVPSKVVHSAARRLLAGNSAALREAGPESTKGVVTAAATRVPADRGGS